MAEASQQFIIGTSVSCSDGPCGELRSVVVDPVARLVTHLVVEPEHRSGLGRLVPLDLVETVTGDMVLRCTQSEFEGLDRAEETQLLPGTNGGYGGYSAGEALYWPYYGLGTGVVGGDTDGVTGGGIGLGVGNVSQPVVADTVPLGEVAVHRGDQVHATDATIGRVQGLVIDPHSGHVTHVLLQEGHLWDRKQVAIPIGAVTGISDDGIRLNVSKDDVEGLPAIDVDHPDL